MKRTTFDEDTPLPLPPHGAAPALEPRSACLTCGEPTLKATLSQYGTRCFACYEAYCRIPPARRRVSQNALRRRPDAGSGS